MQTGRQRENRGKWEVSVTLASLAPMGEGWVMVVPSFAFTSTPDQTTLQFSVSELVVSTQLIQFLMCSKVSAYFDALLAEVTAGTISMVRSNDFCVPPDI